MQGQKEHRLKLDSPGLDSALTISTRLGHAASPPQTSRTSSMRIVVKIQGNAGKDISPVSSCTVSINNVSSHTLLCSHEQPSTELEAAIARAGIWSSTSTPMLSGLEKGRVSDVWPQPSGMRPASPGPQHHMPAHLLAQAGAQPRHHFREWATCTGVSTPHLASDRIKKQCPDTLWKPREQAANPLCTCPASQP